MSYYSEDTCDHNLPLDVHCDACEAAPASDPVPVEGVVLPSLDPSPKNVASAKAWIAMLPHDSKSLQIALLSAEESRLEREDQLREAIAQRDNFKKQLEQVLKSQYE